MTAQELALLYLAQLRQWRDGAPMASSGTNALYLWEGLICTSPGEAWPVFEEVLARATDDETLKQVWYRLRLLLARHHDTFHDRVADLLGRHERLRLIAGPYALDPAVYGVPGEDEPIAAQYPVTSPPVREYPEATAGATSDLGNLDESILLSQQQLNAHEQIIAAWLGREERLWAFSKLNDLCDEDPRLAWRITLALINRVDDVHEISVIAAGPLEDLVCNHADIIWDEMAAIARTNERLRTALRGVWIFADDGGIFQRFTALMREIDADAV